MHSHLQGHPALIDAVRRLEQLNSDQFELYLERRFSTQIESKDFEIDSISKSEDVGIAVRLVRDGKMGFSFTTSLEKEAIARAVQTAFDVASVMPEDENVELVSFGSSAYPNIEIFDEKGLGAPFSQKIGLAKELENACRKADPRIAGIRSASISENTYEVHLVDSHGEHIQHQCTLYTASVTCKSEGQGDSQVGSDFGFSNFLDSLNVASIGGCAAKWATELLGAGSSPTMKCPAVLRNNVVAELVEFLSGSFSAEQIEKGRSMLAGRQGQQVFAEQVTLVDDGLLPGGYGTSPFDGEGVQSRSTVLIDGGFFVGALYDRYYARKMSSEPTANSVRGIKTPPSIGITNFFLQKGKRDADQLLDGISKGILITDLMGVHTANPVTGDFSLGASGILIERGKLTQPVRGFAVAGNVLDLFRKMTDIGNDLRFFGKVGAPSVRVSEISVGGA